MLRGNFTHFCVLILFLNSLHVFYDIALSCAPFSLLSYQCCSSWLSITNYRLDAESRDLRDLESQGPWAVVSRAQRGHYQGPEAL